MQKLHLLTSKERIVERPIDYILLTREWTVATDSHAIVAHKTDKIFDTFNKAFTEELSNDDRYLIAPDQWKKLCLSKVYRCEFDKNNNAIITKDNRFNILDIVQLKKESDIGKYPDWEHVFPSETGSSISALGLSPQSLHNLQQAIYPKASKKDICPLFLFFSHATAEGTTESAIIVKSYNEVYSNDNFKAIMMPYVVLNR